MPEQVNTEVAKQVQEHTESTGHSVIWKIDGTAADAQCQQCSWPR